MSSLPKDKRDYLIVADKPEKSTNWVASLCLSQLAHLKPHDVIENSSLGYYFSVNTVIPGHLLMIDDGAYSGEQLVRYLKEIVIPAIEKTGKKQRFISLFLL